MGETLFRKNETGRLHRSRKPRQFTAAENETGPPCKCYSVAIMAAQKKTVNRNIQRLHCNECRGTKWHKLLKETHDQGSEPYDEDYRIWWHIVHQMFECCGCKSVVVRRSHEFSEWDYPDVRLFPPPVSRHKPEWFYQIPGSMLSLFKEIYNSLAADTRALPMMGARALLDMVIVDKVGDVGTFNDKLKALESQGFISKKNRETLDAALDAGSAAAHRGYAPKLEEVHAVMDIVENLLQAIYVLDKIAVEIKKSTPARPAVKKKASP